MTEFHTLEAPEPPWGDYGAVLVNGLATRTERDGLLRLQRTGPFAPPLTFPGLFDVVVSDAFRRQLEASGLSGVSLAPALKEHIVRCDWQDWDRDADEPEDYPDSGEPEDYVLEADHDESVSRALDELWELTPPTVGRVAVIADERALLLPLETPDLVRADEAYRHILVSARAQEWLQTVAGSWLSFGRFPLPVQHEV